MPVTDPFAEGIARGWKTHDGSQLERDLTLDADIAIVGSGAGGATSAEFLSAAGYKVLLIEEGPLRSSQDFDMQEPPPTPRSTRRRSDGPARTAPSPFCRAAPSAARPW